MLQSPSGLNVVTHSLLFICLSHFWWARLSLPPIFLAILVFSLPLLFSCRLILLQSIIPGFSFLSRFPPYLFPVSFGRPAAGARSSVAAPVAFTCLTAPSHLLSRFIFISLYVCLPISMIVYLLSSSAVSFKISGIFVCLFGLCLSLLYICQRVCHSYLMALYWPYWAF